MSERTEAPTGKRLTEARARGQVVRSLEINAAVSMLAGLWLLTGPAAGLAEGLRTVMVNALTHLPVGDFTGADFVTLAVEAGLRVGPGVGLILLALLAVGVTATVAQTGWLWTTERPFLDLNRINPLTGLKSRFSLNGLVEFIKALLKLLIIGGVAYQFWTGHTTDVLLLGQRPLTDALAQIVTLASGLGWQVISAYVILAAADYAFQRWNLMRSLKMTKEEIKEEFKSQEGNPQIKGRIRQMARRMARQRMMSKVPKADVVITNPTHFAVALQYERGRMGAPQVVAKGAALIAQRIREVAQANDVPIVENPPLARALYRLVDLDQEVPPDLYRAVAEVLAFVYRLKSRAVAAAPAPAAAAAAAAD